MSVPSLQRSLADVVAEYDHKLAAIPDAVRAFDRAGDEVKMAATVGGTFGNVNLRVGHVHASELERMLLKSAWRHVYEGLNVASVASADDRRRFEREMESPPPFTIDNIRGTFGRFVQDPRGNILRGLAEVFCSLDQAYKSHEKVKVGVAGLPKRIILSSVGGYSSSYGMERLRDALNALAAFRGQPLVEYSEFVELGKLHRWDGHVAGEVVIRGLTVRKFQNGNGHVIFDKDSLRDINLALAEFYGDVLPDAAEERPDRRAPGTAVARDLQYYPTPTRVGRDLLRNWTVRGLRLLDPSCGCGRLLDAARAAGAVTFGIEVDASRAAQARAKGHPVWVGNFLEAPAPAPGEEYDGVLMNPPFYGKHYAKHVRHALRFVRPGGRLVAILPATARYDHGLLDDLRGGWDDLPVGSFAESGTNINTTVLTVRLPEEWAAPAARPAEERA